MKKYTLLIITILFLISDASLYAQRNNKESDKKNKNNIPSWQIDTLIQPIPLQRQFFTDKIDALLKKFDGRDGYINNEVKYKDESATKRVTKAILVDVPKIVIMVENMEIENTQKIKYHRATESMLKRLYNVNWSTNGPNYFVSATQSLRGLILAEHEGKMLDFVKQFPSMTTLDNMEYFNDPDARAYLFEKLGTEHPEIFIKKLPTYMNEPFADKLVAAAAKVTPGTILIYAKSTSELSRVVRRNKDPLVQTIVKIVDNSSNSVKATPFIGAIHRGEKSIEEIEKVLNNDKLYLQALVDLIVANEQMGRKEIENEIYIRTLKYVREINRLHNESDAVRFASIKGFRDVDYYAMMIGGQDEIYTSSFVRGTFPQMMNNLKSTSGKEFLEKIHYWEFRTFIRLSAGFNTLATFMDTYKDLDEKKDLMSMFVKDLELGGPNDLADAVNVADAYGSIKDSNIITFLKQEIVKNYERVYKSNNNNSKKGVVVYGLLSTIFNSQNSEDLSDELRQIPPITFLPYTQLTDEKSEVVEQMFFYGDADGKAAYTNFIYNYRNKNWKITEKKYWSEIKSNGDKNFVIYANKPLTEPEDEKAQEELRKYMSENDISPSIVIHRGHSYFVPTTLEHLTPDVKLVMLGSCGGYHNLSGVLDKAPDAHIISSKQVGTLSVNMEIINTLNNIIASGKDLNWIEIWKSLDGKFAKKGAGERELYNDYVPPNKNLGAIFIKAYRNIYDDLI